jgi:hypothetical protein
MCARAKSQETIVTNDKKKKRKISLMNL